jgi:hypothetical protein
MLDIQLHFRGQRSENRKMPALPRQGDFLADGGRLWRVDAIVFSTPTATWGKTTTSIYCIPVGTDRQEELERSWAEWIRNPVASSDIPDENETSPASVVESVVGEGGK